MGSVLFSQEDFEQLKLYTQLLPNSEIACMGYAELADGDVRVNEIFLVPQVISLGSVEFIEKGLPYAVEKADKEGRLNELRFCWHSHATHGAFFSSTDEDMVRKIRDSGPIPWFCSAILNNKGDTHAQLDVFTPGLDGPVADFTSQVTIPLDFTVEGKVLSDREEATVRDIEKFCTKLSDYNKSKSKTSGKAGSHRSGSSSKRGSQDASQDGHSKRGQSLQISASHSEWSEPTGRDERLHSDAKLKKWHCYVDDNDIAHYWHESKKGNVYYKGSAPIPLDRKTGDWAIDVEQTVIDAGPIDGDKPELVPIDKLDEIADAQVRELEEQGRL